MKIIASQVEERGGTIADVANAHQRWTTRRGFQLSLSDDAGRVGLGEASPLPGYSRDTLAEVGQALSELATLWPWQGDLPPAAGSLPASAAFALETAFYDLLGQSRDLPLYRLLRADAPCRRTIPLAALVDSVATAEAAFSRGIRTFKVKVGRDFAAEMALLEALRQRFGEEIALRLDANQAWTVAEAKERLAVLFRFSPEFVEEPAATLLEDSPVPLALDESLQGADALVPRAAPYRVMVLKPAALGGFSRVLVLAAAAPELLPVISHLFDGPIALAAAAHLALAMAPAEEPILAAGLDRHAGLAAWPRAEIPWLGEAEIAPPSLPGLGLKF